MPLRFLDDRERELVFTREPRRIVSLVPSDTLSLFALGAGDRVVGRTRYCVAPEGEVERIPIVGGTKDTDDSAVADLAPDLVICNQEENARQRLEKLFARGVPVYVAFPKTVAAGLAHLARLAQILGLAGDARVKDLLREGYQQHRAAQDALEAAEREGRAPLRAFVPIWMEPLMTIAGGTFMDDALRLAGARNVFHDRRRRYPLAADLGKAQPWSDDVVGDRDTRYPRVTLEEVEAAAPDVVLLPDEPHPFSEDDARVFRSQRTPAAQSGRVRLCGGRDLSWYGAQSVAGIPRLRALVDSLRGARA